MKDFDWNSLEKKVRNRLIAGAVDETIKITFPEKYMGLCHVYAVVGSVVLSTLMRRDFEPIAGVAIIGNGSGERLEMLDDDAFFTKGGGGYHCWIESVGEGQKEIVDFTFANNKPYAEARRISWNQPDTECLWEFEENVNLTGDIHEIPEIFPRNKVWFRQTANGKLWMDRHVAENYEGYSKMVALILRRLALDLNEHLKKAGKTRVITHNFSLAALQFGQLDFLTSVNLFEFESNVVFMASRYYALASFA